MSDTYAPSSTIGPYRIIKSLQGQGIGAAPGIYLARPATQRAGSLVVLKIVTVEATGHQDASSALPGARHIEHPNLIRQLPIAGTASVERQYTAQVDPTDPTSPWYVVFEYLRGGSLRQVLAQRKRLEPEVAIAIALQACHGLARLHNQRMLHLDIKPENILLRTPLSRWRAERPELVLADFGAAVVRHGRRAAPTHATRAYLAPERAAGKPPDQCQDIFSLGVVLYEMLTGHRPYGDDATNEQASDLEHDSTLVRRAGSAEFAQIVLRAIARDPHERYADVGALQADLERLPIEPTGRIKLPMLSGPVAYGLAALAPFVLLIFLGARIISTGPHPNQVATPPALPTAAPTTPSSDLFPTGALPLLVITAAPIDAPQPTVMPYPSGLPLPTSTPMPTATPVP